MYALVANFNGVDTVTSVSYTHLKLKDERFMMKVVKMYYKNGMSQVDIGKKLNVSRMTVARALEQARKQGYVQIKINFPENSAANEEEFLEEKFDLKEAIIAYPREGEVIEEIGFLTADYMIRIMKNHMTCLLYTSYQSFAVTNEPVCNFVKDIVQNSYRIIGLTVTDLREKYHGNIYSYALIDEDNSTYEFKVYGNSYIVFDQIPENVYCFNNASVIGDGLIDAVNVKHYPSYLERLADASLIITDQKLKFNETAVQVSELLRNAKADKKKHDTAKWTEYRFYTQGTLTSLSVSEEGTSFCITDKKGSQKFYTASEKSLSKIKKLLK